MRKPIELKVMQRDLVAFSLKPQGCWFQLIKRTRYTEAANRYNIGKLDICKYGGAAIRVDSECPPMAIAYGGSVGACLLELQVSLPTLLPHS